MDLRPARTARWKSRPSLKRRGLPPRHSERTSHRSARQLGCIFVSLRDCSNAVVNAVSIGLAWLQAVWDVSARMAPYLLFGFAMAGLLHVALPTPWVVRHLGRRSAWNVIQAALIGIPLPLCSCSVIPVAWTLRRQGASREATAAFLMSTPQTGVDSILVTYGLLGPLIAVVRPVAALVSGVLCGWAVSLLPDPPPEVPPAGGSSPLPRPWWVRALRHAGMTLPTDIARELAVGIAIAGAISVAIPPDSLKAVLGSGWPAMFAMLLVGIPMYVCSTASVPIALGFIRAGISPGAALVFLVTGPATNAATLATLHRILGRGAGLVYLGCLVVSALGTGWILDRWLLPRFPDAAPMCHMETSPLPWQHAAAVLLWGLIAWGIYRSSRSK